MKTHYATHERVQGDWRGALQAVDIQSVKYARNAVQQILFEDLTPLL
jgi:hypothetical protein